MRYRRKELTTVKPEARAPRAVALSQVRTRPPALRSAVGGAGNRGGSQGLSLQQLASSALTQGQAVWDHETDGLIGFAAVTSPFRAFRIRSVFCEGTSIAQMMTAAGMTPDAPARIFLDDRLIGDAEHLTTFPRSGQTVAVRAIPAGHGKDPVVIVLEAAVAAALAFAGQEWLAPELISLSSAFGTPAAGLSALGTGVSTFITSTATGFINKLIENALVPPGSSPSPKPTTTPASYSISGNENILAPFSPMPKVYGQRKIYPMLAAPAFTEVGADDDS